MKIGIIGHRSWIAQHLIKECPSDEVSLLSKDWMGRLPALERIYLFAGRTHPSVTEKLDEWDLVRRTVEAAWPETHVVYISSQAVWRGDSDYARHKADLERYILGHPKARSWSIIRPPAVFGPGQALDSKMLVPSLAREGRSLHLREPYRLTSFISVSDLAFYLRHMHPLPDHDRLFPEHSGERIPGTFVISPAQLQALQETFEWFRNKQLSDKYHAIQGQDATIEGCPCCFP